MPPMLTFFEGFDPINKFIMETLKALVVAETHLLSHSAS